MSVVFCTQYVAIISRGPSDEVKVLDPRRVSLIRRASTASASQSYLLVRLSVECVALMLITFRNFSISSPPSESSYRSQIHHSSPICIRIPNAYFPRVAQERAIPMVLCVSGMRWETATAAIRVGEVFWAC